jgi:hypothetical protein
MEDGNPEISVFHRRTGVSGKRGHVPADVNQFQRAALRVELKRPHRDFELRRTRVDDQAANAVSAGIDDETYELAEVSPIVGANAHVREPE